MHFTASFSILLLFSYPSVVSSISFTKKIGLQKLCNQLELSDDQCNMADKTLQFLGYGGLAAAAGTYGVPFVLAKLGFSATGIIGGSLAAWWQANGIAPGVFATIQSASMTGAAASLMTKLGVVAGAVKSYFGCSSDVKISSNGKNCDKNNKC